MRKRNCLLPERKNHWWRLEGGCWTMWFWAYSISINDIMRVW